MLQALTAQNAEVINWLVKGFVGQNAGMVFLNDLIKKALRKFYEGREEMK